jgi:energy-coupling factor transporter ATP-binding protein EcfA2
MKIAFRGFRGFGPDSDFIELKDLTILTGKNGSGKSTFIKLLGLFSDFIRSKTNIEQLIGTSIKIGNEIFGGASFLLHDQENSKPEIVIRQRFDFYTEEHDVHFIFDCREYELLLERIDINDINNKNVLMSLDSGTIITNVNLLFNKYISFASEYNLCTDHLINKAMQDGNENVALFSNITEPDSLKYFKSCVDFPNLLGTIELPSADSTIENLPFNFKHIGTSYTGFFHACVPTERINIEPSELEDIIDLSNEFDTSEYYDVPDIYDELKSNTFLGNELNNILIEIINKEFDKMIAPLNDEISNQMKAALGTHNAIRKSLNDYNFLDAFGDFDGIATIINYIIDLKSKLWSPLVAHSFKIFQAGIIENIQSLDNISVHSNVKAISYRSFNFFDYENSFSQYLRYFKSGLGESADFRTSHIKSKLNELQIADNIVIEVHDTTAFIYIEKGNSKIPLIDDGSGINNLISLIFFLSLPKKYPIRPVEYLEFPLPHHGIFSTQSNNRYAWLERPGTIILEEPESNLHPSLQSKIADLIIDYLDDCATKVIIETHSEYMIRKLQYLVSKGKTMPEKISILYFDFDPFSGSKEISFYSIGIEKNGTLTREFGPGFFDEADNLAIELFNINQNQKN